LNRSVIVVGNVIGLDARSALGQGGGSRCVDLRCLDNGLLDIGLGFSHKLSGIALDEHTLLSHLNLNRTRSTGAVGLPDFGGLTASQGNFLALASAMGAAQRLKEFRLVRVGDGIVNRLEFNAGGT